MRKLFFLMVMCLAAPTMQAQTTPQYVDLGLPSGILWKTTNEKGYHDWESAKKQFGDKLPTEEQWEELKESCKWTWTGKGYRVTGKNGKSIFLPAAGNTKISFGPPFGEYWSSDESDEILVARSLYFDSSDVEMDDKLYIDSLSVRFVLAYVDLGLPSGTKWKTINEEDGSHIIKEYGRFFDYDSAVSKFGDKLPTEDQWEELKKYCTWTWTGKGYKVTGRNGKSIILPTTGYRFCDGRVPHDDSVGYYWSSTPYSSRKARHLYFDFDIVNMCTDYNCGGQNVRLVQGK